MQRDETRSHSPGYLLLRKTQRRPRRGNNGGKNVPPLGDRSGIADTGAPEEAGAGAAEELSIGGAEELGTKELNTRASEEAGAEVAEELGIGSAEELGTKELNTRASE